MTSTAPITIDDTDDESEAIAPAVQKIETVDLSQLPPTYLLPTRLTDAQLHTFEQQLQACSAPLTYALTEAKLFIGDINTARRCQLELETRGLQTAPLINTFDEKDQANDGLIRVVKLKWLTDCLEWGELLPLASYTVYTGQRSASPQTDDLQPTVLSTAVSTSATPAVPSLKRKYEGRDSSTPHMSDPEIRRREILERAQKDAQDREARREHHKRRNYGRTAEAGMALISHQAPPPLLRRSTSEWEKEHELLEGRVMPEYVTKKLKYACQRPHPLESPNWHFISLLQTIKLSRTLSLDPIGIRAYSTAIAAIQAYPYRLVSSAELSRLPGCDGKSSALFHEYIHSTPTQPSEPDENRTIKVVRDLEKDEEFQTLKLFFGIWGVGAKTARDFYFQKGWRSLDDVVEFGWDTLTRVQQIGVKYYDELNYSKIPREEVERIGRIIGEAANAVMPGFDYIITGGYRRGKSQSGDVDIVVSHRDGKATKPGFTAHIVEKLESQGWVTHTLYLGRGGGFGSQRLDSGGAGRHHQVGFDNLEKAMIVWQEQELPFEGKDPSTFAKNPHPHRRVDIIGAPAESAGTAVLGWTGATTYERDLRRYIDHEKGWKFDSGGVWDRFTGKRIEGLHHWMEGESLVDAERRVIEGMGLPYFDPTLRNTG